MSGIDIDEYGNTIYRWDFFEMNYFTPNNVGFYEDEEYESKLKELFDYITNMAVQYKGNQWWADSIDLTCYHDIICFIDDVTEQYKTHIFSIEFSAGAISVQLSCDKHHYMVDSKPKVDAHTYLSGMLLWVIAKSFGFEEESVNS